MFRRSLGARRVTLDQPVEDLQCRTSFSGLIWRPWAHATVWYVAAPVMGRSVSKSVALHDPCGLHYIILVIIV